MKVYKLVNTAFLGADDPIHDSGDGDFHCSLANAGYVAEGSTRSGDGVGAEVSIYFRDEAPRYYIDLMGANSTIANLVADDFPHLIATLKELHPMLTLIGLDQVHSIRVDRQLEREERKRQR